MESKERRKRLSLQDLDGVAWEETVGSSGVFRVQLKPTGINEGSSAFLRTRNASRIMDFRKREKEKKINEL